LESQASGILEKETATLAKPSIWRVMAQILMAPTEGFRSAREFPRWLIPALLCIVVLLAHEIIVRPQTLSDLRQTVQNDESISPQTMQTKLQMIDMQIGQNIPKELIIKGFILLSIIHFGKILGFALLLWLALQLMADGVTYRKALSVTALAFLAVIPEAILKTPIVIARGSRHISLGLGAIFPYGYHETAIYRIFRDLDIFTIWIFVLIAIGLTVGLGVRRKQAYLLVGGLLAGRILLSALDIVLIGVK
jgi:hypothetical protein